VSLNSEGTFNARVETLQNLGVEEIVTMNFRDEMIRAVVKPGSLSKTSKDVMFTVRKEDMLFFDNKSQRVYL
jgi:ABC-type sugar transport system ATPase subunit